MEKPKIKALVDDVDYFIGVDHHKKTSYVTIKDRQGEVVKRGGIVTTKASIADFLNITRDTGDGDGDPRIMAVMECGRAYRPMYGWLSDMVDEVVLAHPRGPKIISETVYKDDKIDSGKLTDLLMLGMVPRSYAASGEAWARRMILRHRVMLVRMQTTIKNRIHVIADLHPDALPRKPEVSDLFGKLGLDWLRRVDLPRPERWRLDELLELLEQLKVKISNSESLIRKIVKQDKRCSLLKTIPGIGDFFSALIVAEVDDIGRFPSAKHFVSYIGLVPRMDKSGSTERGGGLHKQGNSYLRWAFVEAAPHAANSNLSLKDLYDRICARRGKKAGPNIAKCAVARRLAEIAYSVLKEGRPYENR